MAPGLAQTGPAPHEVPTPSPSRRSPPEDRQEGCGGRDAARRRTDAAVSPSQRPSRLIRGRSGRCWHARDGRRRRGCGVWGDGGGIAGRLAAECRACHAIGGWHRAGGGHRVRVPRVDVAAALRFTPRGWLRSGRRRGFHPSPPTWTTASPTWFRS